MAQRIKMDINCEVLENTQPWCCAVFKDLAFMFDDLLKLYQ